ncbi:MAG: ParB/RepB/Spo0J family partition protein [Oscillospiraceae bacterium]|jgi:ParB family chromosome partitioning protein|nr:ParB/RepB/Spo0J family partition protein [Oscillospiraceae bacterium]
MALKEKGMGKGLGALLGDDFSADFSAPASTIPLSQIESCRAQPRKSFDQEKLEELADSIRQHGVIQPLTVRKLSSGYYQIIAGERRWRAARMTELTEIPAVVIEADDQKAMELAMIENLQREDLNPMEEAEGFRALVANYGMTQEEAARRVGKSRSAVANAMRLLDLSPTLQELVTDGQLSAGHARAMLPLSPGLRAEAAKAVIDGGLNVRQTEQLVKRLQDRAAAEEKPEKKETLAVDYVAEAEKSLSARLGRACRISHGKKKGKVEIAYYGVDDLNQLLDALERLGK